MNCDAPSTRNDAIAGSYTAGGVAGLAEKSVGTPMLWLAMAYNAPDGSNVPPSSVVDGASVRLDAPKIYTNSNELPPKLLNSEYSP